MSDTTTTLNAGSGGDVMDESLVTQSDGATQAKRPRVVIAGDASGSAIVDPVDADPGESPYSLPALGMALVGDTPPTNYVQGEIRPLSMSSDGRIRVVAAPSANHFDFFGDEALDFAPPAGHQPHTISRNPWTGE